jgi:hypothetical protein
VVAFTDVQRWNVICSTYSKVTAVLLNPQSQLSQGSVGSVAWGLNSCNAVHYYMNFQLSGCSAACHVIWCTKGRQLLNREDLKRLAMPPKPGRHMHIRQRFITMEECCCLHAPAVCI